MKHKGMSHGERVEAMVEDVMRLGEEDLAITRLGNRSFGYTRLQLTEMGVWSDGQLAEAGLSREEYEVMVEARMPMGLASYAMRMAHERMGMRLRKAERAIAAGGAAPQVILPLPAQIEGEVVVVEKG